MISQSLTTPIQRPATRLEQERDQMLVALDRAVAKGDILGKLPVVQRANWSNDNGTHSQWLAQLAASHRRHPQAAAAGARERQFTPGAQRRNRNLPGGRTDRAPVAQTFDPNAPRSRSLYCDLPAGEVLFTDEELQTALERVRQIIANPPPPPAFEVTGQVRWSPTIGRNKYADMAVLVRFPGPLRFTPGYPNISLGR